MELINAISKVRFGSAKPQRIQLNKGDGCQAEMLCMEPGQQIRVRSGRWLYYVITGSANLTVNGQTSQLPTGQLAASAPNEQHVVATAGDRRLVCLVIGQAS